MMLKANKILLGLVALTFLGYSNLIAQDETPSGHGQIEGTVTDALSGETLIGVNVTIQGTSIGSATNVDGEYVLRRVPAGTQTIVVSYIGYQGVEETIEVTAGETLEYNVAMEQTAVEGQEVVVSSQAEGQRQAINEQINSRSIKNVVSADKIRELPDESAATALSRLPGISLQEGDKVVVRGMEAKMNQVMVNGIQLPSTDIDDRSTNLGFISSNMLAGIEVTKAVTPDMDANSIGGTVNLRLQEAPEGLHFDVMTQGGYNTQDQTSDNYQVWGSVSNRFLDNNLGAFLQVNARRENAGADFSQANYDFIYTGSTIPPVGEAIRGMQAFTYGDQVRITEQRGGSVILDYRLPNGKLAMQNTYAYTDNDLTQHQDVLNFTEIRREFQTQRDVHNKHLIINALQGDYDFDLFNIDYGFSHAYSEKQTDLRYGEDFGHGFRYDGAGSPFERSISRDERLTMYPQDVYELELNDAFWEEADFIQNGGTRDESFTERALSGVLNVTVPFSLFDISGDFQTGGKLSQTRRENDLERRTSRITQNPQQSNELARDWMIENGMNPSLEPQFADFKDYDYGDERGSNFLNGTFTMSEVVDTDLMDQYVRLASPAWGRYTADSRAYDYEGTETLTAGYAMVDLNLGPYVEFLGGYRYEHLNMNYETDLIIRTQDQDGTARIVNESEDPEIRNLADSLTHSDHNVDHLLPNAQLRIKPTDWMDVRLAYTKTLSRPDYTAIVPRVYSGNRTEGEAGNPNLDPSVSDNLDAYVSVYNNEIGLFTVGAFYKKIEDVFYQDTRLYRTLTDDIIYPDTTEFDRLQHIRPNSSADITTYFNNPNPAYVRGLEFEWQTHFWYLPKPLDAMVLNVNYTRIFSEMEYAQTRYESETICDPMCTTELTQIDTSRTARLLHQGDHVVNVAVGADYKGFSGRVSFRMQGDVITSIGTRPEEDAFTGNIYGWDFTVRQQLPIEGLSIFANGINITHSPTKDYQEFPREDDGEVLRNRRRTDYSPRRFQLGVRYSF